jgi:hypothetical protein
MSMPPQQVDQIKLGHRLSRKNFGKMENSAESAIHGLLWRGIAQRWEIANWEI